ncbi:alpha-L-fucosidase [Gelidibacter salicanalis]|uniref:alpha-L-fucosidase n=1 Tax=Gelidibacter salicanalis TaxID=291193 RepID=A0A934KL79_9FLAO|nr:alpha-L-fucosidase [Gelidibacter salicanalis]MBJ7879814.1 alpha-L-fucosidase [Gelidibacter salicanalis]
MKRIRILLLTLLLFITAENIAQTNYEPTQSNLEARQWFEDAKFGLFIHWGVYSILGDGEWVMNNQNISIDAYKKLPSFFNPIEFNAEEWVKIAKNAGMTYITITTRHHDGFSMFDSKASDYNIVEKTPYGKDVIKDLAKACEKEGIKLFFYYSLLDWHNDDYFPRGKTGNDIEGRKEGDWDAYINFMKAQLTELLTNYGDVAGIWFDGDWDKKDENWHYDEIYKLIHELQPQCLIGNNHHDALKQGEDFQMFERDLPGENKTGFGTSESNVGRLPKEVCATINGSWGFDLQDKKHKSKKELIHYLVRASGFGSNLLLNVGPMPNGKIQDEHIQSLAEIGDWLKINGETIYGTKAGIIAPSKDWVSTQKGNVLYVHLLENRTTAFVIPEFNASIKSAKLFATKKKVKTKQTKDGLLIEIPESDQNDIDTIVEITLK